MRPRRLAGQSPAAQPAPRRARGRTTRPTRRGLAHGEVQVGSHKAQDQVQLHMIGEGGAVADQPAPGPHEQRLQRRVGAEGCPLFVAHGRTRSWVRAQRGRDGPEACNCCESRLWVRPVPPGRALPRPSSGAQQGCSAAALRRALGGERQAGRRGWRHGLSSAGGAVRRAGGCLIACALRVVEGSSAALGRGAGALGSAEGPFWRRWR